MYDLVRKALFHLDGETSHDLTLDLLGAGERLGLVRPFARPVPANPVTVMGLRFPNPVGLAAGLDKNGDYINAFGRLGFGFIEVGTVTPRPQSGNPRPRLFRLPEHGALINRMGFNNKGVDHLVAQVRRRRFDGVLGINIGKNKDTPEDRALEDYRLCLERVYPWADYVAVNISSPNTPGLRDLQFGDALKSLLAGIKAEQGRLHRDSGRYVPVAVKIAPDMDETAVAAVAGVLVEEGIDGVIATNTTVDRSAVEAHPLAVETGGLSGEPLTARATEVVAMLRDAVGAKLPIIGVGGIHDGASAAAKVAAGASLVQIYTGFIYRGPELIAEVADAVASISHSAGSEQRSNPEGQPVDTPAHH
ncbi:quinone-dependent dihydroorotate dehydrogenase [Exilibacterium tricleocarpae]|uniref:Dihydroorotate dehydrogenase (quinone) n=1 Tax=Exilibacterium tricleocarpae TaxID=2591008 RepID=A0A545TUU4_9GAMM|nr:quinone-dependent dihydroorotate dehydrogenase [Exilibacterium tricleocarpae]TQV80990.1 quinone-dependent dihydroorotate dehydrogenase [Exilibacterium tricleocarpae]